MSCLSPASAAWISMGGSAEDPVEVRVLESSGDRVVLDYTIPGFDAQPVTIDGATYYRITLPGEPVMLNKGLPELPHVARSVIIPDRSAMAVRVLEADVEEYAGMPVIPSKGNLPRTVDPESIPYELGDFYGSDRSYPASMGTGGEPYVMRDYRGMVVDAQPFQAMGDGTFRAAR